MAQEDVGVESHWPHQLGSWGSTYQPVLSYENGDIPLLLWISYWVIVKLTNESLCIKCINQYKQYIYKFFSYAEKPMLLAWLVSCGWIPLLSSRTFKWCTHVTTRFVLNYKDFWSPGSPSLPSWACSSHPALQLICGATAVVSPSTCAITAFPSFKIISMNDIMNNCKFSSK